MAKNLNEFYFNDSVAHYHDKNIDQLIKNMQIHVLGYGRHQTDDTLTRIDNFSAPFFLLVFYEQGSVTLTHKEKTIPLSTGSLYLFKPFELFSGTRTSKLPLTYTYLYFDITPISSRATFMNYAFTYSDGCLQQPWYKTSGADLIKNAYSAAQRKVPGWHFMLRYAISGIIAYTMYTTLASMSNRELRSPINNAPIIDQAFAYIAQHETEPIDIGKLVSAIGTSRTTLERVFKESTQLSPIQAMTRYKIREALKLLQKGRPLKETAHALGYSSSSHLSATFKKILGKSPRDYLNN